MLIDFRITLLPDGLPQLIKAKAISFFLCPIVVVVPINNLNSHLASFLFFILALVEVLVFFSLFYLTRKKGVN